VVREQPQDFLGQGTRQQAFPFLSYRAVTTALATVHSYAPCEESSVVHCVEVGWIVGVAAKITSEIPWKKDVSHRIVTVA